MAIVKRRIFSGNVLEQEVYRTAPNKKDVSNAEPIQRFENEEERARHREGMSRRHHARLFNTNFTPQSLYSTLTLDNDNEVHTFEEAKQIRDLYVRRLKYASPDAQIMIYMGRGKSTNRIHFHMVSNGLSEEQIENKWNAGKIVRIENLRANNYYNGVDHGQDYTGLANYLFNHWKPEQGGHRWKQTRNMQQPGQEEPKPIKRQYSEKKLPPVPKGYKFVEYKSNSTGYQYFKWVKETEKEPPRQKQRL